SRSPSPRSTGGPFAHPGAPHATRRPPGLPAPPARPRRRRPAGARQHRTALGRPAFPAPPEPPRPPGRDAPRLGRDERSLERHHLARPPPAAAAQAQEPRHLAADERLGEPAGGDAAAPGRPPGDAGAG